MATFLDEILEKEDLERADRKLEVDRLTADALLGNLAKIEAQMSAVCDLVASEARLLEDYRKTELERLEKKRSWIVWNLSTWMNTQGEKTVRLIRGVLKLRLGRDKIEITDQAAFQKVGEKLGLLRITTKTEPDLNAIRAYLKTHDSLPGITIQPAETKFSYSLTKGNGNGKNGEAKA